MTTTRLYYPEAYRASFDAHVLACEPLEAPPATPAAYAVELDATAFYPSSGGQPFDTGTLGARLARERGATYWHWQTRSAPQIKRSIRT